MKYTLSILLLFFTILLFSQNYRDKIIHENIYPIINKIGPSTKADYEKAKELVLKLDADYGYEADIKKQLIEHSFQHNDIEFFKPELSVLVEEHGCFLSPILKRLI